MPIGSLRGEKAGRDDHSHGSAKSPTHESVAKSAPSEKAPGGHDPTLSVIRDELAGFTEDALHALGKKAPLDRAEREVRAVPGLYAIYADAGSWLQLGLGEPPDKRPLYVGKAERSLVSRDLATHFGNGRTGSSTVRRSFAALLREPLGLAGRPRNPDRPERFANYGLSPEHDKRLTDWMREKLELAVWSKPANCEVARLQIEVSLLVQLMPPLNLKDVTTPWTGRVSAARATMAADARLWTKP